MASRREYSIFGRQVGYIIAANILMLLAGLVEIPIVTKALGASDYGIWSLILVTNGLIVPFAGLALGDAIIRFLAAEKDRDRVADTFLSICTVVFISASVASLLLFALAGPLARSVFRDPDADFYVRLASALIILTCMFNCTQSFMRMQRKIGLRTVLALLQSLATLGLIILFVTIGYGLTGVVAAALLALVLTNVVAFALTLRETGLRIPRFVNMKKYLRWSLPMVPNAGILWIINVSDRYMVSYFIDSAAAGVYSAAYSIGNYAYFALFPLGMVLYPNIVKTYDEGHPEQAANYLKYGLKYLMMISIPSAFGLTVLSAQLLDLLTTAEFAEGSKVIPLVAFGGVIFCLYQIGVYIIHVVNKTYLTVWLLGSSALLNVVLNAVLIPRMGMVGAAVATVVAYGVLGLMTLTVTRRFLKFDLSLPFMAKSIASSGVMALCIWLLDPRSLWPVLGCVVLGAVVYFVVLISLRGLSKAEINFFINFVREALRTVLPIHK
ncbi:MAG: oligosaccharide flippase family protein [Dehalococcoidia bacterium]|nr:oligosaccharide flippase family protein [Dehalococcoidia bacterium]